MNPPPRARLQHAMIGALIGVGVASNAGVTWGYVVTSNGGQVTGQNGLGSVIASFAISPLLAGILGFLIFTLVKVVVLQRQGVRSFYWALAVAPFWYALVGGFEAWLITWKSPRLPSSLQDNVSECPAPPYCPRRSPRSRAQPRPVQPLTPPLPAPTSPPVCRRHRGHLLRCLHRRGPPHCVLPDALHLPPRVAGVEPGERVVRR